MPQEQETEKSASLACHRADMQNDGGSVSLTVLLVSRKWKMIIRTTRLVY